MINHVGVGSARGEAQKVTVVTSRPEDRFFLAVRRGGDHGEILELRTHTVRARVPSILRIWEV